MILWQYKGLSASIVAGCIQVIRELPEEDILSGEELAKVACTLNLLKGYQNIGAIDHLRELVQAEKDGRLVVLPCKLHKPVFYLEDGDWFEDVPYEVNLGERPVDIEDTLMFSCEDGFDFYADDIGKTVFLTREEAEAALKGESNDTTKGS